MSKLDDFRAQYPGAYDDMGDSELADALYRKNYSDMPREEFDAKMGLATPTFAGQQQLSQLTQGAGSEAAPEQDQAAYDAQIRMNMRNQKAQTAYDELPGYLKPLQSASDMLTTVAHPFAAAATGAASLLSPGEYKPISPEMVIARLRTGKLEGPEFDAEVAKQKQATEDAVYRSGWAGTAGQVAVGAMLPVARIFGAGKPLLNTTATGSTFAGLTAAGNEENPLLGAAGGVAGALGGSLLGKGISMAGDKLLGGLGKLLPFGPLKVPPKAPSLDVDDFKSLASTAYKEAESHGVVFNKAGLQDLKAKVGADFTGRSYDPVNEPGVEPILRRIDDYIATGNVTFEGLQSLRRLASNGYRPGIKSNNALVSKAIDRIDEMVDRMNPAHMAANTANPKAAAEAARYARTMYHKGAKLETVNNLIERGTLQGDTNISKNVRQSVRKQVAKIIDPTRHVGRGFTAAEKEAVRKTVKTTNTQDIMHGLSGLVPRDKLSAALTAGSTLGTAAGGFLLGGPVGALAAIPVTAARFGIGIAAEKAANRMAQKSVDDLVHLLSTGQTTKQAAQSVLQKLTASKRAAVMQGLARAGFALAASTQPLNEPEVSSRMSDVTGRIGGML